MIEFYLVEFRLSRPKITSHSNLTVVRNVVRIFPNATCLHKFTVELFMINPSPILSQLVYVFISLRLHSDSSAWIGCRSAPNKTWINRVSSDLLFFILVILADMLYIIRCTTQWTESEYAPQNGPSMFNAMAKSGCGIPVSTMPQRPTIYAFKAFFYTHSSK